MKNKGMILLLSIVIFMNADAYELSESPQFNVTVNVVGIPSLIINTPRNLTYFSNESVKLNLTSNSEIMWYSLDGGSNLSYLNETILEVAEGSHLIRAYANNSYGARKEEIIFSIYLGLFKVIYEEYKGPSSGSSINFNSYSFEEVQNLNNIILENVNYGKIVFNENINITDDHNLSDNILDLDSNTEISFNRIDMDLDKLKNFEKNATIYLYNLSIVNPRIVKNGIQCPLNECQLISYIGGKIVFNATGLGNFSIEENQQNSGGGGSGGSGGGGGSGGSGGAGSSIVRNLVNNENFILDKEEIFFKLRQGEARRESITIENTEKTDLIVKIENNFKNFLRMDIREFTLKSGEKTTLFIEAFASENSVPELYFGKILISSESIKKEIPIKVEVESRNPLFDVGVKIAEESSRVKAGDNIMAEINLVNLEAIGTVKTNVFYQIKNYENNIIFEESEIVEVRTASKLIKTFHIPEEARPGIYELYVYVNYDDKRASGSDGFIVANYFVYWILSMISISILLIALVQYLHFRKKRIAYSVLSQNQQR